MMMLPLMLQDKRAGHVKNKWTIWVATMVSAAAVSSSWPMAFPFRRVVLRLCSLLALQRYHKQ